MKHNIEVGQKLYYENTDHRGVFLGINEVTVDRVARKYFYVKEKGGKGFCLETLKHSDGFYLQSDVQLYLSYSEIENKNKSAALYQKIKNEFNSYTNKFSLTQLIEINKILERD